MDANSGESASERNMEFHDVGGAESIGPFERYPAVVNGWTVPRLEVRQMAEHVDLSFDGRFGLELPTEVAGRVVSYIADIIAVERGFACHPRKPRELKPPTEEEMNDPIPPKLLPWRHMVPFGAVGDDSMLGPDHG